MNIKEKMINAQVNAMCKAQEFASEAQATIEEAKTMQFTKKGAGMLAKFCLAMLAFMLPATTAFAADKGSTAFNNLIDFAKEWLVKIGLVIVMVGGVMFAIAFQREDAEGKTRGLMTAMSGGMIAAIGGGALILDK